MANDLLTQKLREHKYYWFLNFYIHLLFYFIRSFIIFSDPSGDKLNKRLTQSCTVHNRIIFSQTFLLLMIWIINIIENSASRKQPKTKRNTNVRETKLIAWLKEPNKITKQKPAEWKHQKSYFILEDTEKYISHQTEIKTY